MKLQSLHQFLWDKLQAETISVDLIKIMLDLVLAAKLIGYNISRNKLFEVASEQYPGSLPGAEPHPLNILAHDIFRNFLEKSGKVTCHFSFEISGKAVKEDKSPHASYIAFINPLDYSNALDTLESPGSIFSVYPHLENRGAVKTGRLQKLAGYFLYGNTITLVLSLGEGVQVFSYDAHIGEFLLTHQNLKISKESNTYCLIEESQEEFPAEIQSYLNTLKSSKLENGPRYINKAKQSLIANTHQCLTGGGLVLYPQTKRNAQGSLKLMYAGNPMAYLIEQAGGLAIDGMHPILDRSAKNSNQCVPFIAGSYQMVKRVLEFYKNKSLSIHSIYCC